jgi:uncharacterized protein (TIGR02996 family)
MYAIVVSHPEWPGPRRFMYPRRFITIGTHRANELALSGDGIEERHARMVPADHAMVLYDLSSKIGTYVNGRRLVGATAAELGNDDRVQIAQYSLAFRRVVSDLVDGHRPYVVQEPVEHALLQAIATGDDASRVVYADWLEQQGDVVRAAFLRVQEELRGARPGDAAFSAQASRLAALADQIDVGWRIKIASASVERCGVAFDLRCPMKWSALQPTGRDGVRHCTGCKQDVYYALSVGEARAFAKQGHCVALDAGSARWRNDLAGPFGKRVCERCNLDIGDAYRAEDCPSCGFEAERYATVGMIAG